MKWLYLCALVILSVILVRASSSEENDQCRKEIQEQRRALENCTATNFDEATFVKDFNVTLTIGNDDDSGIREFAGKYCPKLENTISCLPLRYQVSDKCHGWFHPFEYDEAVLLKQVLLDLLKYICENNAEVISQVYKDDGLLTIILNEQLMKCVNVMYPDKMAKYDAEEFELDPEYCPSLEGIVRCYVEIAQTHRNQNLVGIANAIWARAKNVLKC